MSRFFDLHTKEKNAGAPSQLNLIFATSTALAAITGRKRLILKNLGGGIVLVNIGTDPVTANHLYELSVDEEMTLNDAFDYKFRTKVAATTAVLEYLEVRV